MASTRPNSLGKSERLKSRKQIDILFESGKKITQFPFLLIFIKEAGRDGLKAGFTVSSKNFPRAVDRNRIKRLTREAYRVQKKELEMFALRNECVLHLFFIYTGKEIASYQEIFSRLKQLLDKLIIVVRENDRTNT
ncbi:MAG TPA: ribonuclease P protein component [Puia sp.]|jgi:ribonuclease P protein component